MFSKTILNASIAIEAISNNRLRALLTSLGLIFGVASVISMLSIGKGAEQEIMEQLKILGANNVIVKPVIEQEEGKVVDENEKTKEEKRYTPGLSLQDVKTISTIPHIDFISPEVVYETLVIRAGLKRSVKLVGIKPEYFLSSDVKLAQGNMFSQKQLDDSAPVCIIGNGIKAKFFPQDEPIGKSIKCGEVWLRVIGIVQDRKISEKNISKLGIRDYNMDIYAPISTVILRSKNRALVTKDDILRNSRRWGNENQKKDKNYHQIDRVVIRVENTEYMAGVADILTRMLTRLHNEVIDFEIILPQALLEQEKRTKNIFNIVLGAIASISLLVGGIGIMNIMLASVLERIREIGIRMAVGATSNDIIMQFLLEAIIIGITGGLLGIILGFVFSYGIEKFSGITTIITPFSIFLSLIVSVSIGLVFGILPAKRAAEQDPVISLRYE
ncbi:MAG: ABC transporter permease [Bacteroidota bacterium]